MSKDKKTTTPKPRADKYEAKVSLSMDFQEALKKLSEHANKEVKSRQNKPKE